MFPADPSAPRRSATPLVLAGVLAFVTLAASAARAAVLVPTDFVNESVVQGFDEPNSFAFLPDGRVIVTEQRTGRVRIVADGVTPNGTQMLIVPNLNPIGYERGLQGVAVDPQWPSRPYVYLFYQRTGEFHRLVRYKGVGDLSDPASTNLDLAEPLLLMDDIPDVNPNHNSGCLRFGPDGMLYLSLGEDDDFPCQAADRTSLRGQILRLDVSGLADGAGPQVARSLLDPGDNPWAGSMNANERLVHAYGMRNPWRFQLDPETGVIYGCDVGEATFEEENEIHAGDFLGWPWREGDQSFVRASCPEPGGVGAQPYVSPILAFSRDGDLHAIVSAGMYRPVAGAPSNWPADYEPDRGDVFYMDYYVGDLKRLTWNGSSWVAAAPAPGQPTPSNWATGLVTGVDFLVGPDGSLWWLAQYNENFDPASGSLNRIRYAGTTSVAGDPPGAAGIRVRPNPVIGAAEVAFDLAREGRVRLTLFGLDGARVRTLADGAFAAGAQRLHWDGRNDRGDRVPAGVYFARLEDAAGPPRTVRILKLR